MDLTLQRRPDACAFLRVGAAVMALSAPVLVAPAVAQNSPSTDLSSAPADIVRQRNQELEKLRAEQRRSFEARQKLELEIDAIGADRRQLNQSLIEAAANIRAVEERIASGEQRLQPLADNERVLRGSLEQRRDVIAEVLAALQRMGRRPPPAVIVRPEDALESVRAAMMLGAVVPDLRRQAEAVAADLTALIVLRRDIAYERDKLTIDLAELWDARQRMTALVGARQKRQVDIEKSLEAERQRAAQLSRQADNLKDLIAKLEQGADPARGARGSGRPGEDGRANVALNDPGRLGPAIAFASAKGLLPFPVNGVKTREFGAADGLGGSERGISIATRPDAQVTAPCDGWVVYAAPYRSYGQLLILNAGGGYHVLLAGMERISVDVGQFILTGEPVAVMGSGSRVASAIVNGSGQPLLYVEFRKDGSPVDSAPWWVTNESEKVRG